MPQVALGILVGAIGAIVGPSLLALGAIYLHHLGVIPHISGRRGANFLAYFNFVDTIVFYAILLLAVFIFARPKGRRLSLSLGLRRPPYWLLLLMPPAALALQIAAELISAALSPLLGGMHNPQSCDISQGFGADPYLGVLAIVVIAPFVEEIVFRGFVYGGLRHRLGGWTAALGSGAIFALAHTLSVGGSILLLGPSLFLAGVVLALVYERSRSLVPGMILHGSFNGVAVLLIFLVSKAANCG